MQWAWDKRKTKPDTEERSIHEAVIMVVDIISAALMGMIQEEKWEEEAKKFGTYVRTVCDMMYALDCGVDVEDYPRVMYETTRILESLEGEHRNIIRQMRNKGKKEINNRRTETHNEKEQRSIIQEQPEATTDKREAKRGTRDCRGGEKRHNR